MSNPRIRWGILGNAGIAKRSMIPAIKQSQRGTLAAIASRDLEGAKATAEQFGIAKAYGSYDELLADPEIDAVYIPLLNHVHKEWTIRAAQAGKHVLCEKPLALNQEEAKEMVAACEAAGVLLAEAFMYRHHPRYAQIREVIEAGQIGDIRTIHGNFTFNAAANKEGTRFKREWGGGSIYDIGVYPINVARTLLGTEPVAATVHALFSEEHDNVDMMAAGLLEFPGDIGLTFDCGMWGFYRNSLQIVGTDGIIDVPSAFVAPRDAGANFFVTTAAGKVEVEVEPVDHFSIEADDFARAIQEGVPLKYAPEDALANMAVVDACLRSAKEKTRVTIG